MSSSKVMTHFSNGQTTSHVWLKRQFHQAHIRLDLLRADSEHQVCVKQSAQKQCHDNKARSREFMLETKSRHETGEVSIWHYGNRVWRLSIVGLCHMSHVIYMDSGLDWKWHVDSWRLLRTGLPGNVEPDIEQEIALLTRETTTDLASTSTMGLPKSTQQFQVADMKWPCQILVIIR